MSETVPPFDPSKGIIGQGSSAAATEEPVGAAGLFVIAALISIVGGFLFYSSPKLAQSLQIDSRSLGMYVASFVIISPAILLISAFPIGMLSDRYGRRWILVFGLGILALGLFFVPLSRSIATLVISFTVTAIGTSVLFTLLIVLVHDKYSGNARGQGIGFVKAAEGIGAALFAGIFWLWTDILAEVVAPGTELLSYLYFAIAAAPVVFMLLLLGPLLSAARKDKPDSFLVQPNVLNDGSAQPSLALANFSGFVAGCAVSTPPLLISMWVASAVQEAGSLSFDITLRSVLQNGAITIATILSAPVVGVLIHKANRTRAVFIAAVMAACTFFSVGLLNDPFSTLGLFFFAVLIIGQTALWVSSHTIIGYEAPPARRGRYVGLFVAFGALGSVLATIVASLLFVTVAPAAPLFFVASLCVVLAIASFVSMRREVPGADTYDDLLGNA